MSQSTVNRESKRLGIVLRKRVNRHEPFDVGGSIHQLVVNTICCVTGQDYTKVQRTLHSLADTKVKNDKYLLPLLREYYAAVVDTGFPERKVVPYKINQRNDDAVRAYAGKHPINYLAFVLGHTTASVSMRAGELMVPQIAGDALLHKYLVDWMYKRLEGATVLEVINGAH